MKPPKELQLVKRVVDIELANYFRQKKQRAKEIDASLVSVVDAIASFTLRSGKRIRPYLCWLGYNSSARRFVSPQRASTRLRAAMLGIELFHTYILIHDDIIDKDATRRGGRTLHEHFKRAGKHGTHIGVSTALLAGDLAYVWAQSLLMDTRSTAAMELFVSNGEQVVHGQLFDVAAQYEGTSNISKQQIDEYKTSWYSVIRPLQIGAVLAQASKRHVDSLARFGLPLGLVFQVRDDALDHDIDLTQAQKHLAAYEQQTRSALDGVSVPPRISRHFSDMIAFAAKRAY